LTADLHGLICSDQHLVDQGEAIQTAHAHALATSVPAARGSIELNQSLVAIET
jgi:hypothetical protein